MREPASGNLLRTTTMNYFEAVEEIIEKASQINLPGEKKDVIFIARSQFLRFKHCDAEYMEPIEAVIKKLLQEWSWEQKDEIWRSIDTSGEEPFDPDEVYPGIDLTLQDELLGYVIEELSGRNP
jgi:hypothetical protein